MITSVISSMYTYFKNNESSIKYNIPIHSTVINYNKFVTKLDIETIFLILEIVRSLNIAINQLVTFSLGI